MVFVMIAWLLVVHQQLLGLRKDLINLVRALLRRVL